jgi:hypothetical protein
MASYFSCVFETIVHINLSKSSRTYVDTACSVKGSTRMIKVEFEYFQRYIVDHTLLYHQMKFFFSHDEEKRHMSNKTNILLKIYRYFCSVEENVLKT